MNRLISAPARWCLLLALLLCCGCDGTNQLQTNRFAVNSVSRSATTSDQGLGARESLVRPDDVTAGEELPAVISGERQLDHERSTFDPLRSQCEAELRGQSSYPFDFRLRSLKGRSLTKRQFAGRLLVVDIWATWCGPCVREVPHFIDLQEEYRDAGLSIVGINFERTGDDRQDRQQVELFARSAGINYPLAIGNDAIIDQVEGFRGFPTTLFIDGKGQVRLTLRGSRSHDELETYVKILLQDQTITRRGVDRQGRARPLDRAVTDSIQSLCRRLSAKRSSLVKVWVKLEAYPT